MRRTACAGALLALAAVLLFPAPALADNCGSLSDCYGVLRAALAAMVGIALLVGLVGFGWSALGFTVTVAGVVEAITGRSLLTGERLAAWERMVGVIPLGAFGLSRTITGLAARAAAAAGRRTILQQGLRILSVNRHAAAGSRISRVAHDFAARGLRYEEVERAVIRAIGPLRRIAPGMTQGSIRMGNTQIRYNVFTRANGESVVNFFIDLGRSIP